MRPNLSRELRYGAVLHKRGAHRVANEIMNDDRLPETHFRLGGVDVDVDFCRWHFQKQKHHGIHAARQNVAIGVGDGVLNEAVTDQASISKNVNRIAVELLQLRLRSKAMQA